MIPLLAVLASMARGALLPVTTRTYTAGTAATETVPAGATQCVITADGGGAAGGRDSFDIGGGGGGGSRVVKTIDVIPGDTFIYTVAALKAGRSSNGIGANGNASTVTGTVAGGSVNISAGGGLGGSDSGLDGDGGTATGGDVNTPGNAGWGSHGGNGAGGGLGGNPDAGSFSNGSPIGGGGGGTVSTTSGSGARGEIKFEYFG